MCVCVCTRVCRHTCTHTLKGDKDAAQPPDVEAGDMMVRWKSFALEGHEF